MKKNMFNLQQGEVSLFIVIFATLLLTIVTVSFARIMMHDQQQATTIDLSQSAYDSAQAGVEDAKRAILYYQSVCGDPSKATECNTAASLINSTACNAFATVGGLSDISSANVGSEVKVQSTGDTNALDQAYTCTKITLDTPDYTGFLTKDSYDIIPLIGTDNDFDTVQISWFTSNDYPANLGNPTLLSPSSGVPLLPANAVSWPADKPPILRTQLIQFGNSFMLDDFNEGSAATGSNTNTLFLYPSGNSGTVVSAVSTTTFTGNDNRLLPTGKPYSVRCSGNLTSGGYSCSIKLTLPRPINPGDRTAFLRIGALYNASSYRVSLIDSTQPSPNNIVNFNGVQPIVDSTGRANDLFRRVQARVTLSVDFPYPNAEIYTNGDLCKNFIVTDDAARFSRYNTVTSTSINGCTP